jgi:hypothetical protein
MRKIRLWPSDKHTYWYLQSRGLSIKGSKLKQHSNREYSEWNSKCKWNSFTCTHIFLSSKIHTETRRLLFEWTLTSHSAWLIAVGAFNYCFNEGNRREREHSPTRAKRMVRMAIILGEKTRLARPFEPLRLVPAHKVRVWGRNKVPKIPAAKRESFDGDASYKSALDRMFQHNACF